MSSTPSHRKIWLRGEPVQQLPVDLPGWPFADGVFRTVLVFEGQIHDAEGQWQQLLADAEKLGLPLGNTEQWWQWILQAANSQATVRMRWMLLRAAGGSGYRVADAPAELIIDCQPLPTLEAAHWQQGIVLGASDVALAHQPRLAGIKHLNRLEQILAVAGQPEAVDELLLCDADGHLICGSRSNLFWVQDGELQTPWLDRCGIAGRMRARILQAADALQILRREVRADCTTLLPAQEVFVSNSLIGIWPVRQCLDRALPAPGPVTQQLSRYLQHPLMPTTT